MTTLTRNQYPRFDIAILPAMRELWEEHPELSAADIARRFSNVTKNTVIGQARRRGWAPRRSPDSSTIFTRLDALEAKIKAVLAETRPFVEDRKKITAPADEQRAAA